MEHIQPMLPLAPVSPSTPIASDHPAPAAQSGSFRWLGVLLTAGVAGILAYSVWLGAVDTAYELTSPVVERTEHAVRVAAPLGTPRKEILRWLEAQGIREGYTGGGPSYSAAWGWYGTITVRFPQVGSGSQSSRPMTVHFYFNAAGRLRGHEIEQG